MRETWAGVDVVVVNVSDSSCEHVETVRPLMLTDT